MKITTLLLFFLWAAPAVCAQSANPKPKTPPPIQDNSFLLEEAYNQEAGVVQHINTFTRLGGAWLYTFTQEWPVFSQKHQFSYTVPALRVGESPLVARGLGDIALNYRYQLLGDGGAKVALAPRFSVLLPTGNERRGLGVGAAGIQFNFPASVMVAEKVVTHWNAGVTYVPGARNERREKADLTGYNVGGSVIWQTAPVFNLMLETVWNRTQSVAGPGRTERDDSVIVNPGIRWAHNFRSGLQIVPGVAVPVSVGPGKREAGIFFYLSFEHPFTRSAQPGGAGH